MLSVTDTAQGEQLDARTAFLAERMTGIGGSDAASIVGLNPWKSAYRLFLEKTGQIKAEDLSDNAAVTWGTKLEDVVAEHYAEVTGATVHRVNRTLRHPQHPFMMSHLDRRIVGDKRGLEVKTAGAFAANSEEWGASGTDEIPAHYLCQVQHYMAVTGYVEFDLAVLMGGRDFRIYTVRRHEQMIESLIAAERDFWRRVVANDPPSPRSIDEARDRWPQSKEYQVQASPEIERAVSDLRATKNDLKKLAAREEELAAQIMVALGDGDTLMAGARKLATWKSQTAERFDAKAFEAAHSDLYQQFKSASSYRVLRLAKQKGDAE